MKVPLLLFTVIMRITLVLVLILVLQPNRFGYKQLRVKLMSGTSLQINPVN